MVSHTPTVWGRHWRMVVLVGMQGGLTHTHLLYGVGTGEWLYWWACRVVSHTPTVWGWHWRMVVLVGMQGGLTHTYCMG